ncbi:hypothetical protein Q427_19235 [Halomonas sp. BC04]|nr:hypothetical protein Q427_19235 [Halomonas sp. BC04]
MGVSLGGIVLRLADSLWLLATAGVWLLLLGLAFAWLLRQWRSELTAPTALS